MIPFLKKLSCLFFLAAVILTVSGCGSRTQPITNTAPPAHTETTAPTVDPLLEVEELAVVLSEGELYTLSQYPNLKSVDLSGSTCYEAIQNYILLHPQITVTYTVDLGSIQVENSAQSIVLDPGSFSFDTLLNDLKYLPNVTSISFPEIELTGEQIALLREAYPEISLDYTVHLFGTTYSLDADSLDLSGMDSSQVEEAVVKLGLLPNLTEVKLSNALSMEDVAKLQDANPNATFLYSFSLFGQTLSTTTETVTYKNQNIGNEGADQIRQALRILDNCSRFLLDNCKIDSDVLAEIREEFRDKTTVAWRIYFGDNLRYNALTDQDTIRAVYHVSDENVSALKYCEGAKYIDMGHNDTLTDLSFVSGMPNLEVFIGSGCAVVELTGFENCKKLTWLELANCLALKDIDALAGCESLRFLNISYSKVGSFLALDGLPLERFIYLNPKASTEEQNTFIAIHSGCRVVYYGYSNPYTPWRYDDNGKTFNAYYKDVVREAFNYDYLETLLPKD